jgi:hypothetical protein
MIIKLGVPSSAPSACPTRSTTCSEGCWNPSPSRRIPSPSPLQVYIPPHVVLIIPRLPDNYCVPCPHTQRTNHGVSQYFFMGSDSGNPSSTKKERGNRFTCDLQICCHFTTQNRKTDLKTNDETNTFLVCLFVLSEQLDLIPLKENPFYPLFLEFSYLKFFFRRFFFILGFRLVYRRIFRPSHQFVVFHLDSYGDHLQTCQSKSTATQIHDWFVYKISGFLGSVGHRVKIHKITSARGKNGTIWR